MVSQSYKDKLLDPRWQKKRLKILERDDFQCTICFDKENTLHVHHLKYAKSGNPWDSPDEELVTYCCHCHKMIEEIKSGFPKSKILKIHNIPGGHLIDFTIVIETSYGCKEIIIYKKELKGVATQIIVLQEWYISCLNAFIDG